MKKKHNGNLVTHPPSTPDNTENRPKSTNASGPKTPAGKRRVRFNARAHGFYSRELVVREDERAEYDALKEGLRTDLNPTSHLQQLGYERVVSAAWRFKLALRMEAMRLRPQLEIRGDPPESEEASTDVAPWHTARRQELNRAAKFLTDLAADVRGFGEQHLAEKKDLIVKEFGFEFFNLLAQWGPISTVRVLANEQLQWHAKKLKLPLPAGSTVSEDVLYAAERLRWDMMAKVVDLKLQAVGEHYHVLEGSAGEAESPQTVALDVVNRYVTSTGRELERAVDWYGQLLEKGL